MLKIIRFANSANKSDKAYFEHYKISMGTSERAKKNYAIVAFKRKRTTAYPLIIQEVFRKLAKYGYLGANKSAGKRPNVQE